MLISTWPGSRPRLQRLLPLLHFRRHAQRRIALPRRHPEQGGEQRYRVVQPVARTAEHRLEPGQLRLRRRRAVELRRPLQQLDHRIKRAVGCGVASSRKANARYLIRCASQAALAQPCLISTPHLTASTLLRQLNLVLI